MANYQRDAGKERFWRDVLQRHAASGLSVRAFCGREQLTESAFYAWRRTIALRDGQAKSLTASPPFVPVVVTELPAREASLVLELAGGLVLRMPASICVERLAYLLQALAARGVR